jgi:lipopolysaccharide transport system ATP-binding protein
MYLRLAFAIATHFQPDILILDEIIGAGDEAFQKKALARIDTLLDAARIVLFSSHDVKSVRRYCNRAIVLEHGKVIGDGDVDSMLSLYQSNPAAKNLSLTA